MRPKLWTERPVSETIELYTDWAESYDHDVTSRGYHTPRRIAEALRLYKDDINGPVLDFGCGTGISGVALTMVGFDQIHGTDITEEMLNKANEKNVYRKLWHSQPGDIPAAPGTYQLIVAAGVVSLGAAPPETLSLILDALASGSFAAISFNEPTLNDGRFDAVLNEEIDAKRCEIVFRENGPHLDDMDMTSDVIILRRI